MVSHSSQLIGKRDTSEGRVSNDIDLQVTEARAQRANGVRRRTERTEARKRADDEWKLVASSTSKKWESTA